VSVRVILVDDHSVVRKGVRALLEKETDLDVVGEASNGLDAIELVSKMRPDLVVLDLMMPGMHGLEVARRIIQEHSGTRVIVLSMHSDEGYVLAALRNGVSGYVLKDTTEDQIVEAIRKVSQGERYLSPPISERAIEAYIQKARQGQVGDPYETLTNREREILQLSAQGLSNPEIATRLYISPRTVETHRSNLMHKLGLASQTDLIRFALKRGLID
jgi:DNA-binding NarL/FixJ family response regulator